jgi:hypothetical protein
MADVIIIEAGLHERNYWRDVWQGNRVNEYVTNG